MSNNISYDQKFLATITESNLYGTGDDEGRGRSLYSSLNDRGDLFLDDIEQSHHFTITLDKIAEFWPRYYKTKFPDSQYFLPVKSISFTKASIENMNIPLGVIGSLPIMHRKNLGRLTMVLYDIDREPIESAIQSWIGSCFQGNDYVNYLSNIVGTLNYTSYGVDGRRNENVSGEYYVIPAESITLDRSYDANDAKLLNFSVVIIG